MGLPVRGTQTGWTQPLGGMLLPGMGIVKEKVGAVTPQRWSWEEARSYPA